MTDKVVKRLVGHIYIMVKTAVHIVSLSSYVMIEEMGEAGYVSEVGIWIENTNTCPAWRDFSAHT